MHDVRVPLNSFLDAAGPLVRWVSQEGVGDRYFTGIQFLTEEPRSQDSAGILWICPTRTTLEKVAVDPWLLQLSSEGAAGLIMTDARVASATRLLANRLQLPLMTTQVDELGRVMDVLYRLLVGADNHRMRNELEQLQDVQNSWRESSSLEDFIQRMHDHEMVIIMPPGADWRSHPVEWGRGRGTQFSLSPESLPERVVAQVALAIGVFLDLGAAEIESSLRHRSEFLLELLVDPHVPTGSVIRAAERYNLDLGRTHTAFIWDLDQFRQFVGQAVTEDTILRIKGDVLGAIEEFAIKVFGHGMVLPHSDEFVLIIESRERIRPEVALRGAATIRDHLIPLLECHGVSGVTCGVGFPYDGPAGLRKSFEEAHEALTVGRARYGFGTIAHFKDLGLERFLYGWLDSPRSRELAEGLLRPLLNDPMYQELVQTLEVYLNNKGRMAASSQILHVHRNTLRYRLDRAQQLLKLDLDDAATQLVLQLALKARHELH